MLIRTEKPLAADRFAYAIYSGKLLMQSPTIESLNLQLALRKKAEFVLGSDPEYAHKNFQPEEFYEAVASLQNLENDDDLLDLFKAAIKTQVGGDIQRLYHDRLRIRVVPPRGTLEKGANSSVPIHRDTWGVSMQTQVNWWMPLYELKDNGVCFFPRHWSMPIRNNTGDWQVQDYYKEQKSAPKGQRLKRYAVPSPLEIPHPPCLIPHVGCGYWLIFSAAQLHTSAPNESTQCRISFETRTLDLSYSQLKKGAPNTDNQGKSVMKHIFRNLDHGSGLDRAWL